MSAARPVTFGRQPKRPNIVTKRPNSPMQSIDASKTGHPPAHPALGSGSARVEHHKASARLPTKARNKPTCSG
ncbi:hypothetical protein LY76DRAFT_310550 [Colletotrichum caudatum]|nr:hypothetical protein LY76DRAFT_310550 [Colletotrichum caudatum]